MRVSTEFKRPVFFILFISCLIGLYILYFPPLSWMTVLPFLLLAWFFIYGLSRIWLRKKYSLLLACFAVSSLTLKAISGFDTMNTILLVSLFVGILILLK